MLAQLLTKPVYKSPGRVSRNLNYGASLPLTPLGTGDQPEPWRLLTLWLDCDSGLSRCSKRCPAGMPRGTRLRVPGQSAWHKDAFGLGCRRQRSGEALTPPSFPRYQTHSCCGPLIFILFCLSICLLLAKVLFHWTLALSIILASSERQYS